MLNIEVITGKSVDEIRRIPQENVGLLILLEHYEHTSGKKRIADIDKILSLIDDYEGEEEVHIIGNSDNVADLVIAMTKLKTNAQIHVYVILSTKDLEDDNYMRNWNAFLHPCLKSGALNRNSTFTLISDDRIGELSFNNH